MRIQIAIDGPAGSGKSTIAKMLSKELGINYMDTGAMYRAVAYALIQRGISVSDSEAVKAVLDDMDISVEYTAEGQRVFVSGTDVTPYIRTHEISKGASDVAVIPEVRIRLASIQRAAGEKFDIVMDGRDIGTYVLPNAGLKLFVTASPRVRAERRKKDLEAQGKSVDIEELTQDIIARDKTDSTREFMPLRKAEDAILLDTSEMSIEEVISFVKKKAEEVFA